jgi:hypothetical protein
MSTAALLLPRRYDHGGTVAAGFYKNHWGAAR